jgi:hypothetical protein
VTTDTDGGGPTGSDPLETWVRTPEAGQVTITEGAIGGSSPAGFQFLGQTVTIVAPDATPEDPLWIAFSIDDSLVPPGETPESIDIYGNGVPVPDCTGAEGVAAPDPCVFSRETYATGLIIRIFSSTASEWNVAIVVRGNADCDSDVDVQDAVLILRAVAGFLGPLCVQAADVDCDGELTLTDMVHVLRFVARLPLLPVPPGCPSIK